MRLVGMRAAGKRLERRAASVLLLLAPSLALVAGQPAQQKTANINTASAAMTRGLAAMQQGDVAAAKREFSAVVRLAPQVEPGHAALGSALLTLGEYDAAARELETARKLAPDDFAVDLNLGRAMVAMGHYNDAVKAFGAGLRGVDAATLAPEETLAYAKALAATNQLSAAAELLQRGAAAAPDSALLQDGLGTVLAQQGKLDEALPDFERAVAIDSSFAVAQLHAAAALLALDRSSDAISYAQASASAMPESFDAQLQLGRALSAVHRDVEALQHLHRAAKLRTKLQTPATLYSLALALEASGDAKGSLPIFADALAGSNVDSIFARGPALINYALASVLTGDAAGALPLYAEALAAGPDSATLREDFGAAYLQKADLDHAIEQFKAGLTLTPDNAHLHYDLGLAYKLKDNLDAAIPEFERSAALDTTLPDPAYTLGVIYMQQGRSTEAVANLKRATALQPENGDAWALLGNVLKDSGDATGANEALRHAIELQPDQPSLHIQLATLENQAGHTAEAAAERKVAADLSRAAMNRQRADFALKSGRTLLEQNKLPEAVLQLNTAAHAAPTLAEPHKLLAEAYLREGKAADAALERQQAEALATPKAQ